MYWFSRPPYLRYAAATLLVLTAIWIDLRPEAVEEYPFAATDLPAGHVVADADLRWREIPAGVLPPVTPGARLARAVSAGAPLVAADFAAAPAVPDGWWTLEMDVPGDAVPGQELLLVLLPDQGLAPPDPIPAIVVAPASASPGLFGSAAPGRVAVPPELAATAAGAVADGRVTLLLGSMG